MEIFIDAQTKNIVENKLKLDEINTLSNELALESHG